MFSCCLQLCDFENSIIPLLYLNPSNQSLLKFELVIEGIADKELLNLDTWLGREIGDSHSSFINRRHPTSIEIASVLLKCGENVNGHCFQAQFISWIDKEELDIE